MLLDDSTHQASETPCLTPKHCPRGEVVVAPGQILEAHARHAKANALVAALDRRVIPREPTAAAEGRLSLVVDGVLVGHRVALACLAQLGVEEAVLMPHIEDGRRRRHLLLSQLRDRGFVADAGAGHANGRDLLVVGRLVSRLDCLAPDCVEGPRIDGPRLRVADRQGGAKEAQHLAKGPFLRHGRVAFLRCVPSGGHGTVIQAAERSPRDAQRSSRWSFQCAAWRTATT